MVSRWETVPNLPPNLESLGNAFQKVFPNRDQASDGAWGDAAHKLSPSGHNLDDTPGSLSETNDPDNIPELRAIDVDSDLRKSGVTMQMVCDKIIATPADRNRLYYIIYNRRIAGTHTGWKWVAYTGSSPHTEHAHFSGDPGADENGNRWVSIEEIGDDMSWDEKIGGDTGNSGRTFRQVIQDIAIIREWLIGVYGSARFVPAEDSTLRNLEKIRFIDKGVTQIEAGTKSLTARITDLETELNTLSTLVREIHATVTKEAP